MNTNEIIITNLFLLHFWIIGEIWRYALIYFQYIKWRNSVWISFFGTTNLMFEMYKLEQVTPIIEVSSNTHLHLGFKNNIFFHDSTNQIMRTFWGLSFLSHEQWISKWIWNFETPFKLHCFTSLSILNRDVVHVQYISICSANNVR